MSMARFIFLFAAAGVLVPQAAWWVISKYPAIDLKVGIGLQKLMLVLWPSTVDAAAGWKRWKLIARSAVDINRCERRAVCRYRCSHLVRFQEAPCDSCPARCRIGRYAVAYINAIVSIQAPLCGAW